MPEEVNKELQRINERAAEDQQRSCGGSTKELRRSSKGAAEEQQERLRG
jgi:hypothetical protein